MSKNGKKLKDTLDALSKVITILGLLVTLVSLVLELLEVLPDPTGIYVLSAVGFAPYLLGTLWFAFKATDVSPRWRWTSLVALYIVSCFYSLWMGTWINTSVPESVIVDEGISVSRWSKEWHPYADLETSLESEKEIDAMRIDYDLPDNTYVTIQKGFPFSSCIGTKALRFVYKGGGEPNTLEIKLIYAPDENVQKPVFQYLRNRSANQPDWESLEVPYSSFTCWPDTGCTPGEALSIENAHYISISVSNKPTDTPGAGYILIDEIRCVK
jgi:hypothetical protein